MTTPQLHRAASSYVFRLLGRGRARAQRAPGNALGEALAALRAEGQSALIEVELASGSLGRLLIQVGRLVFVQHRDSGGEKALAEIYQAAADAQLYILELSDEQIILACAALGGIPLALGEALGAGSEELPTLLAQLTRQHFTGVMALEQGLQTLVWRFQRGRLLNALKPPEQVRVGRLTQFVWQEQLLPEIGDTDPAAAHTHAADAAEKPVARSLPNRPLQATVAATDAADPLRRVTPALQTQFNSAPVASNPDQASRRVPGPDTEEVWARFRSILQAKLGNRAERVFSLMQSELGRFSGAELTERLARQVERLAGSAAARTFRDGR